MRRALPKPPATSEFATFPASSAMSTALNIFLPFSTERRISRATIAFAISTATSFSCLIFAFSRGLYYKNTPPFVIGRPGWDNWLVWHARQSGARVVDATAVVQAIHQNHDYSYHPDGAAGVWQGEEAQQNYALLDGGKRYATIANATHRLTPAGLRWNWYHWVEMLRRKSWGVISSM